MVILRFDDMLFKKKSRAAPWIQLAVFLFLYLKYLYVEVCESVHIIQINSDQL